MSTETKNSKLKKKKDKIVKPVRRRKPIDKVTTTNLDIALRVCGIHLPMDLIDKMIDIVELIEEKGDDVSIRDLCSLKADWDKPGPKV